MNSRRISSWLILTVLLAGGGLLSLNSCDDKATLPAFVRIDTIILDSTDYDSVGSVAHKIEYAWLYIDDNLQGVYKLPARVPVIGSGPKKIKVYAGVSENGFSTQATRYIFYNPWEVNDTLVVGDTLTLQPHVKYDNIKAPLFIDFDNNLVLDMDKAQGGGTFQYMYDGLAYEGTGYGYLSLLEGESDLICTTKVVNTPKGMLGYFMELNYKNNCDFLVGVQSGNQTINWLGIKAKDEWNKIYINLTTAVDQIPGTNLQLYLVVPQDTTVATQEVRIDNFKFLY